MTEASFSKEYPPMPAFIDLSGHSFEETANILSLLVEDGYLLHGSNGGPYADILPSQGGDTRRASGRLRGVYATDRPRNVFAYALLDRCHLSKTLKKGGFEFGIHEKRPYIYVYFDDVRRYMEAHLEQVFSEGYVYILPPDSFTEAPDCPGEFCSPDPVYPLLAIKIGATLARELFVGEDGKLLGHPGRPSR